MIKKYTATNDKKTNKVTRGQFIARVIRFVIFISLQVFLINMIYQKMTAVDSIQINSLEINDKNLKYLDVRELKDYFLENRTNFNLLTVDLAEVRSDIEKFPWVKMVYLRKMLPDILVVYLEEHVPIAFFNDGILTESGEVIYPQNKNNFDGFIHIYGPKSYGMEIYTEYQKMSKLIDNPNFRIVKVELTDNYLWNVYLSNGLILYLGHKLDDSIDSNPNMLSTDDILLRRLAKFKAIYKVLDNVANIEYLDLRYQTGVAIKWKK